MTKGNWYVQMKVLLLGPRRDKFLDFLIHAGELVTVIETALDKEEHFDWRGFDFVISFGYRFVLDKLFIEHYKNRAVNLHISLLPWNRGADPNLWSFLENTPKGVTIHYIDEGLDTGAIIIQKEVFFDSRVETLNSSYLSLCDALETLFFEWWHDIKHGIVKSVPQEGIGSYHRSDDKKKFLHLLTMGWDTPVSGLVGKAVNNSV